MGRKYVRKRQASKRANAKRDRAIYLAYLRCVHPITLANRHGISVPRVWKIIKAQREQYPLTSDLLVDQLMACDARLLSANKQLKQIEGVIPECNDDAQYSSKYHQLHDSATKLRKLIHDEQKFKADLLAQLTNDANAAAQYQEELNNMTDEELQKEIGKIE